jgi:aerobic carbon-monoxide dehydrogenase small subunit
MNSERLDTRDTSPSPSALGRVPAKRVAGRGVRASADDPPMIHLETTVNGHPVSLEIEPRAILLDVLRHDLGLTGAKRSCDTQVCGACTVLLDGSPVSACCTLAYEAGGRKIETIEGLAGQRGLHPIQQAFVDRVAIQCGFCTPGFVLATKALLAENPQPTRAEIEDFLGGNLCRCTGYWNILDAVADAAGRIDVEFANGRSEAS